MLIIPDLFTPWIEGREKAIDRNWSDLTNYGKVQKSQLDNAFAAATFSPKVNQQYNLADKGAMENLFTEMTFDNRLTQDDIATLMAQYGANTAFYNQQLYGTAFPGLQGYEDALSRYRQLYADPLAAGNIHGQLAQLQAAAQAAQYTGDAYGQALQGLQQPQGQVPGVAMPQQGQQQGAIPALLPGAAAQPAPAQGAPAQPPAPQQAAPAQNATMQPMVAGAAVQSGGAVQELMEDRMLRLGIDASTVVDRGNGVYTAQSRDGRQWQLQRDPTTGQITHTLLPQFRGF